MENLNVKVQWCDKNFACVWGNPEFGVVTVTNKTFEGLKKEFELSLKTQINDMVADGEYVPEWLVNGDYMINYEMHISAVLRMAERFTTMAAISRVTGINQRLLTHYASSIKEPRKEQREKIISGLHCIGNSFLAMQ